VLDPCSKREWAATLCRRTCEPPWTHPVRLCANSKALGGDLVLYPSLFFWNPAMEEVSCEASTSMTSSASLTCGRLIGGRTGTTHGRTLFLTNGLRHTGLRDWTATCSKSFPRPPIVWMKRNLAKSTITSSRKTTWMQSAKNAFYATVSSSSPAEHYLATCARRWTSSHRCALTHPSCEVMYRHRKRQSCNPEF